MAVLIGKTEKRKVTRTYVGGVDCEDVLPRRGAALEARALHKAVRGLALRDYLPGTVLDRIAAPPRADGVAAGHRSVVRHRVRSVAVVVDLRGCVVRPLTITPNDAAKCTHVDTDRPGAIRSFDPNVELVAAIRLGAAVDLRDA